MGMSNALQLGWLGLYFNQTPISASGLTLAATANVDVFLGLYSAYPGAGGNQTTSEIVYTPYARVDTVRTNVAWTVSGASPAQATNAGTPQWPACTAGAATATFVGVGRALAGAGVLDYAVPIGVALGTGTGVTAGNLITVPALAGVALNDPVIPMALSGTPLPGGLTEGVTVFVKTLAGDTFTVSATAGGLVIPITSDGSAIWYKSVPVVITPGIQPDITPGNITLFQGN